MKDYPVIDSEAYEAILKSTKPPRRKIVNVEAHFMIQKPTAVAFWCVTLKCHDEQILIPGRDPEPKVGKRVRCTSFGCLTEAASKAWSVWNALG